MVVQAVVGALAGLALIGWGVRVLVRGEAPVIGSTGRAWRSVAEATLFWFLLGLACLVGPFVWLGASVGWMGPDAGFWILCTPIPIAVLAVTWFRPRRAAAPRGH